MALRDRDRKDPLEKVIEINAQMQGTLHFKDPVNLKITNIFSGTMELKGTLTITETSSVEANISGENVIIAGKIKGDITAKKMLVLMPTAIVHGNITTSRLNIVEGAIFQGQCHMMDDYFDVDELAKYLELDTKAILDLASNGKIPAVKAGETWRFERTKIDEWASTGKIR